MSETLNDGQKKNVFLDQFVRMPGIIETKRSYEEVAKDMEKLWKLNPTNCIRIAAVAKQVATNMVSKVEASTEENMNLQDFSLTNEGILRMFWLASKQKITFAANVAYFISVGSWKDIFSLLTIDIMMNGWNHRKLDWVFLKSVIVAGLINEDTVDEVKKHLPSIKSNGDMTTDVAKANNEIGKFLSIGFYGKPEHEGDFSSYKKYRKLKSNGVTGEFLQAVKKNNLLDLDLTKTRGKSLCSLVGDPYLKELGTYSEYADLMMQSLANVSKFSIFDVFKSYGSRHIAKTIPSYERWTIEAWFQNAVDSARKNPKISTSTLVVRDISSSNEGIVPSIGMSSYAIAKSLALFFSTLNTGYFHDKYLIFTNTGCELRQFKGEHVHDKWINDSELLYSENNSLAKISGYFASIKSQNISEGELPREFLIISDEGLAIESLEGFKLDLIESGYSENYVNSIKVTVLHLPNKLGQSKDEVVNIKEISEDLTYIVGMNNSVLFKLTGSKSGKMAARTSKEYYNEIMDSMPYCKMRPVQFKKSIKFAKAGTTKA